MKSLCDTLNLEKLNSCWFDLNQSISSIKSDLNSNKSSFGDKINYLSKLINISAIFNELNLENKKITKSSWINIPVMKPLDIYNQDELDAKNYPADDDWKLFSLESMQLFKYLHKSKNSDGPHYHRAFDSNLCSYQIKKKYLDQFNKSEEKEFIGNHLKYIESEVRNLIPQLMESSAKEIKAITKTLNDRLKLGITQKDSPFAVKVPDSNFYLVNFQNNEKISLDNKEFQNIHDKLSNISPKIIENLEMTKNLEMTTIYQNLLINLNEYCILSNKINNALENNSILKVKYGDMLEFGEKTICNNNCTVPFKKRTFNDVSSNMDDTNITLLKKPCVNK